MLARIQNDLAGIHRRLCGAGPASTVADIAHRRSTEDGLAAFARNVARAALGHDWHVGGVEIRPIDGWGSLGSDYRAVRRHGPRLALGVDKEGTVFLNNPAIILGDSLLGYAINQRHTQIAGRWERQRHGRG